MAKQQVVTPEEKLRLAMATLSRVCETLTNGELSLETAISRARNEASVTLYRLGNQYWFNQLNRQVDFLDKQTESPNDKNL